MVFYYGSSSRLRQLRSPKCLLFGPLQKKFSDLCSRYSNYIWTSSTVFLDEMA